MSLLRFDRDGNLIPSTERQRERPGRHNDPSRAWRSTAAYRAWRRAVLATSDRCAHCGTTEDLTAGHVKSAARHPELRLDPSNGRVECRSCNSSRGDN